MLRTIDTFSGIGGFSYGLERLCGGFETVAFVEQDKFCQKILRKHWPDVPIHDDIRTFSTDGLGRIDLLCGGFPCQPWSVAGKREGHEDSLNRDLWPEMARIIQELRPRWVIGENVRGFVNEPMGLARTLTDLDSLGYQSTYWILPAASVGAPHRRDRVWIVAHATGVGQSKGEVQEKVDYKEPEKGWNDNADIFSRIIPSAEGVRGHDGVPRRVDRLKALGNAVVPQVVAQIGKAILSAEEWENSN